MSPAALDRSKIGLQRAGSDTAASFGDRQIDNLITVAAMRRRLVYGTALCNITNLEFAMLEREVIIATPDGAMDCFFCTPEESGPHPGVILYMDAPGIREELRETPTFPTAWSNNCRRSYRQHRLTIASRSIRVPSTASPSRSARST